MFSSSPTDHNATSTEPMVLSSSGNSPNSPYLPSFLIGENSSNLATGSPRLWSIAGSPTKYRSPSPSVQPSFPVHVAQQASHSPRTFSNRLTGEKVGGPPVQSLFDSYSSPARSEGRSLVSTPLKVTSPLQADSSGLSRDSSFCEELDPDDTWVTVFGFPPGATSYILQQFSQYGTVIEDRVAPNGNWVHVHYQSKLQAKKALSKNGKIFGDSIMVGVKPCTDKVSIAKIKSFHNESCKENLPTTSTVTMPERPAGIRPLSQAYRMAASEREVTTTPPSRVPQKTGSLVSKAMEYVFSW